jgi:hypothetical protein
MCLLAILAGCALDAPSPVTPSPLPIPTRTPFPNATNTLKITSVPSVTKTPAIAPSYTPLPTLSSDERERRILGLISSNNDCDLPCWWGITPGRTTFAEARNFFRQFNPHPYLQEEAPNKQFVNYLIPVSETISFGYGIDIKLEIVDGIVQIVSVGSIESATIFSIRNILSDYGQPLEVWIHTYRSYLGGIPPVDVLLFYPDQGILARYSAELTEINESGDSASICLDHSPSLTLWSPEEQIDFEQAQDYARLDYKEYGKPLLPLDQATTLSLDEFYEYRTQERICLTTTLSVWPEP